MTTAIAKWGDIGDWDVSEVKDFSDAFSTSRDETGGTYVQGTNSKAAAFVGTDMSKWTTTSVTSLSNTFRGAKLMNSDLSAWKVGKVVTLADTFAYASNFAGTGLDLWDTAAITDLAGTFRNAGEMNVDLSAWKVGKVTTMVQTFQYASTFEGKGLTSWDTSSVTTLALTFASAGAMNADLSLWNVAKVTTLYSTFNNAAKYQASGLEKWDVGAVVTMRSVFSDDNALSSCTKRKIADTWATLASDAFKGTGYTAWADGTCPVRFK